MVINILLILKLYFNSLGITDQHYALFIIALFITQAPTCFETYVPSSGSVVYPCELVKVWNWCVIGMYPRTVNVCVHRMLWFRGLLQWDKHNLYFIPLHICASIEWRCFKYIWFWVSSVVFMDSVNVLFIWSYVNKTNLSNYSCTPFKHPILDSVFLHSMFYTVCFFCYLKHCTLFTLP
jgi:hypothetical protein